MKLVGPAEIICVGEVRGAVKLTRPARLKQGSRLAVVSPASATKPELIKLGMERLRGLGYEPVLSPHALDSGPLYYAGRLEERVADLHAAFADPAIDGIICSRGGWGSAELLPHLDAGLIRANPKAFVGYSDHTSLHSWLQNEAGLATFYGPMVASDFARENGVDVASWMASIDGEAEWSLGIADGLRVLREGSAEGELRGGCISILAESLGTAYAAETAGVLFLEDIGTKPYQWDRLLLHLRYAGRLDGVTGIVFGDMKQCVAPEEDELPGAGDSPCAAGVCGTDCDRAAVRTRERAEYYAVLGGAGEA